jgi:hypothetical protein
MSSGHDTARGVTLTRASPVQILGNENPPTGRTLGIGA